MLTLKNKKWLFLGLGLLLIAILVGFFCFKGYILKIIIGDKTKLLQDNCSAIEKSYIRGVSMEPSLNNNQEVSGYMGYYNCHEPKKNDPVVLEFKSQPGTRFVKKIMALGGDKIEFKGDNLMINGKIAKNSEGKAYQFSTRSQGLLTIPLENKTIIEGYYLVLGEVVGPEAYDSRVFGYVEKDHLKGLVSP